MPPYILVASATVICDIHNCNMLKNKLKIKMKQLSICALHTVKRK